MACRHDCHKDRDTGELFCPWFHRWVEICPFEAREDEDREEEGEDDD